MLSVFNIQRYSLQDGDGIRTNIFFKGCTLNCQWCNNPEGIDAQPSLMFDERLCQRFGDCIKAANGNIKTINGMLVIAREKIGNMDNLRDVCPARALSIVGKEMTVNDIIKEVEKDRAFYQTSSGGVTITGGEPLAQGPELKELLAKLKKMNINISAETCLHLPWTRIESVIDFIDVFLADLKHTESEKFIKFTGGDASLVMNNFRRLDRSGRKFIVRVPVIPGFNFSEDELSGIIDFAAGLKNATEIDFVPYHSLAKEKYIMLGKDYIFEFQGNIDGDSLKPFIDYAHKKGLKANILN